MKKKYSYIGLSLIILIFGIIVIPKIVETISSDEVVKSDRLNIKGADKKLNTDKALSYIEINGRKKIAPEFQLINQDGDTVSSKDYRGKVYVAEFFFTTCPTICPIMNQNLVEVQEEFKIEEDFGIASFSIDPKHDTPEVLNREYAVALSKNDQRNCNRKMNKGIAAATKFQGQQPILVQQPTGQSFGILFRKINTGFAHLC